MVPMSTRWLASVLASVVHVDLHVERALMLRRHWLPHAEKARRLTLSRPSRHLSSLPREARAQTFEEKATEYWKPERVNWLTNGKGERYRSIVVTAYECFPDASPSSPNSWRRRSILTRQARRRCSAPGVGPAQQRWISSGRSVEEVQADQPAFPGKGPACMRANIQTASLESTACHVCSTSRGGSSRRSTAPRGSHCILWTFALARATSVS